ncbi:PREDICTED: putative uncharacterized protein C7orf71 homolog [Colobus angolensis palliatus]|uniref:putative uncharacterized protein C7orf71 homolog n=1 Tax=Colobus angolensis palliatus TaxID=336983 RepID=UPI0005F57109|nr:PREDICTED: putative uncharacterized protein C7orf71 homolog [Colobus angolensis palliatus]
MAFEGCLQTQPQQGHGLPGGLPAPQVTCNQNLSEMGINHDLEYSSIIPMMKRAFPARGALGLIMSGVFDNPGPIKNTLKKAFTTLWSFTIYTRLESLRVALSNEETIPFIFHPKTQAANMLSGPISTPMLL